MGQWMRKVRGLAGLAVTGGVLGALLGGVWWLGTSFLGIGSLAFGSLPWTLGLWAGFGAVSTTGMGTLVAVVGTRRTLEDLSPWQAGAAGAVMGAAAPVALVFALTGGFWVPSLGLIAGASGLFGGVLGSGLVLTAQRAEAREIAGNEARPAVGPGS